MKTNTYSLTIPFTLLEKHFYVSNTSAIEAVITEKLAVDCRYQIDKHAVILKFEDAVCELDLPAELFEVQPSDTPLSFDLYIPSALIPALAKDGIFHPTPIVLKTLSQLDTVPCKPPVNQNCSWFHLSVPMSVHIQDPWGIWYNTAENFLNASRTLDIPMRRKLTFLKPAESRQFWNEAGNREKHERPDWEQVRQPLMYHVLTHKYNHCLEHQQLLRETSIFPVINFNRQGDTYWGVNSCSFIGKNLLGKMIMHIRHTLLGPVPF